MTVDLRTCVPGQLVALRNGNIVRYIKIRPQDCVYSHLVEEYCYTDDGHYYSSGEENDDDVVRILPLDKPEQPKSDTHPSVVWWESCPWITDRKPTPLDGDVYGRVYVESGEGKVLASNWSDVGVHEHWIHLCGWQPLKQTPKEKALALIAKYRAGWDTHDNWVPTPDDWIIIREGLAE